MKESYYFTKKQDVLASNQKYPAYNIGIDVMDEDALNRVLQD